MTNQTDYYQLMIEAADNCGCIKEDVKFWLVGIAPMTVVWDTDENSWHEYLRALNLRCTDEHCQRICTATTLAEYKLALIKEVATNR